MKKRKVYLDGELGEKYGKELSIVADSFADVFRCLEANYPDVRQYILDCHEKNIGFLCEIAEKPLTTEEELLLSYPEGSMYICPQPMGADSGLGKVLAALAIVALVIINPANFFYLGTEAAAAAGVAAGLTNAGLLAVGLAVNLALTGIMQIMAPDPATDGNQQDESYLFQGSGQTIIEGDPVPVLYGKLRVPARPISLTVENAHQQFVNLNTENLETASPLDQTDYDYTEGNQPPINNPDTLPDNDTEGGPGDLNGPWFWIQPPPDLLPG